jgi:hypothetical protein
MARPSNADVLQRYRDKINAAKKWRRDEGYDDTWRRLSDLYRGRHYEYLTEEDRLLVNISFSTINVIAPSVAVNYPKITVNARRSEDAPRAIITEAVINYWWKHFDCRPEFRRAVKDFLIFGHGWIKCGYRYIEEGQEESPEAEPKEIEANEEDSNVIEPTVVVVEDRPFVERVSVFDVFVDPDATSMQDAHWIAQRVRRPLKEVRQDKRYNATARRDCSPSSWGRISDEYIFHREVRDKEEQYVEVWEFYDLRKKTMSVFADGGDQFLIAPREMPYAFGHPFVMIRNYDIPDEFYPMGELEAIEPLQRELNETRTQMMNHRKRFSRKYLYKESAFDAQGRNLLQSEDDNVMVPVQSDENISNVITPLPAVITPPEFYNQSGLISADIETISGVSEYMRGQMPEMKRTATEASIIADAANARAADKLATIELAISAVAGRLVQLAQQFMDSEQVVRIVGKNGEPAWVTFDVDYISGEFDFEVESGSTAPNNESFRRQQALQLVDAMAPFASAGIVDMGKLAAHVLQFGFGIKNPESFLQSQPPPQAMPPEAGGMPPEAGGMPPEMPPEMAGGMPAGMPAPQMSPEQSGELPPELMALLESGL